MIYSTFCIFEKKIYICAQKLEKMDKSIHSHLYHQVIGRLRGKREKLGVTQIQLAELLKVTKLL